MSALTPALVMRAGLALYGEEWQAPLARLLNVNPRTMRRVAQAARDGTAYAVNPGWADDLRAALRPIPLERKIQAEHAAAVLEALGEVG